MFSHPYVENIKKFFFEAMVEGWVADGEKFTIPQLPGYKAIEHCDGDFHLVDCYCKNPEYHGSSGFTTIYWKNNPVWVMHYGGDYINDKAVDFLKYALSWAYKRKRFCGGRGPSSLCAATMIYINTAEQNDFTKFSGRETIHDAETGQLYGHHIYQGMALF